MRIKSEGPSLVERGTLLKVRLQLEGIDVRRGRADLWWDGHLVNVTFAVSIPRDAAIGEHLGHATITLSGLRIARVAFTVLVGTARDPGISRTGTAPHRTAFASYASKDRSEVVKRVHGLRKGGVDVFMDVLNLRSGQRYENVLREAIRTRDVFYLFWSRAASQSSWVEKEWRLALELRGIDYIDPFPLISPRRVPPPPELGGELHFNDWEEAFLSNQPDHSWWQFWRR